MDPKATIDAIDQGLAEFKQQVREGKPASVLLITLADVSEQIENLADWIAKGGFVLVAPEEGP